MSRLLSGLLAPPSPVNKIPVPYAGRHTTVLGNLADGVYSGDRTAQLSAMGGVGTLFAIVDGNASAVAMTEWKLWRKAASGKREDRTEVTSHAALTVWNQPNQFFSRQELHEVGQQHFELVGELIWIVAYDPRANFPIELWPVRPDKMEPVPSDSGYLLGWVYTGPDGEKVPFDTREVLFSRRPNPMSAYRGMGAVQSILTDLDSTKYSAAWNRNFFINGAKPGGVIEIPTRLSDPAWTEFRQRWSDQHKGVSNAHRVAMLEHGAKWVDVKYSMRDMMYPELRNVSRETIREAFRFPKPMLGAVDDVNRANAEAGEYVYAKWHTSEKLARLRTLANTAFLPLFGSTAEGLEFDFVDPVPANVELENATTLARAQVVASLLPLGFTAESLVEAYELPSTLVWKKPEPEPMPTVPAGPEGGGTDHGTADAEVEREEIEDRAGRGPTMTMFGLARELRAARRPMVDVELPAAPAQPVALADPGVDLSGLQADWQAALDELLKDWDSITEEQRAELRRQIEDAVASGDLAALAALTVSTQTGSDALTEAMIALAVLGAAAMVAEAATLGVTVAQGIADAATLGVIAATVSGLLAAELCAAAGREAARRARPGMSGEQAAEVADAVDAHLAGLSDRWLRDQLGGALTAAQNMGRIATASGAHGARYYASEILDGDTCRPCREVDGTELPTIDAVNLAYGGAGYLFCQGTVRCRGTFVLRWPEGEES